MVQRFGEETGQITGVAGGNQKGEEPVEDGVRPRGVAVRGVRCSNGRNGEVGVPLTFLVRPKRRIVGLGQRLAVRVPVFE